MSLSSVARCVFAFDVAFGDKKGIGVNEIHNLAAWGWVGRAILSWRWKDCVTSHKYRMP